MPPPVTNGLVLELDARKLSLADGTALSQWDDLSGNANHATQATAAAQPKFYNGVSGGPAGVRFDVTDDFMQTPLDLVRPYTVFVRFNYRSTTSAFRRAIAGSTNWLIGPYQNKVKHYAGNWVTDAGGPAVVQNQFYVCAARNDGTRSWFFVDGVDETDSSTPIGSPNTIYLGKGGAFPEPLDGDIVAVLIYNRSLTDAERASVESYLAGNADPDAPARPTCDVTNLATTSVRLTGSAFSDPQGDAHAASQWQVDEYGGGFAVPVYDSGETTTDLTAHDVTGLIDSTNYIGRVRYKDAAGNWSVWSDPRSFATLDPAPPAKPTLTNVDQITVDSARMHGSAFVEGASDPTPPTIAGCLGWYAANELALNDGDAVTTWNTSPNGGSHNLATAVGTPRFRADVLANKPAVEFQSAGLRKASVTGPGTTFTAFIVARIRSVATDLGRLFDVGSPIALYTRTAGGLFVSQGTQVQVQSDGWAPTSLFYLYTVVFKGDATTRYRRNGTAISTISAGANSFGGIGLACTPSGAATAADLLVLEFILVDDEPVNLLDIETYLMDKYNL